MADAPGIGTYLRNMIPLVVRARPDWQFRLIGHSDVIDGLGWRAYENVNVVDCRAPIYTVREQVALWRLPGGAVDAFWSPHYNIPLTERAPLVVTVHDVIHLARPEYTGRPIKQLYARAMFEMARRRAAAIITVSDFTRREFERLVGRPAAPITVAPNGVDPSWFTIERRASERPYLLCIAAFKPHKNLRALIDAFRSIQDRVPHDLVVVGRREGLRTADRWTEATAAALGDRIRFAEEVGREELGRLMAGATALVHPSLYEGFGLPPLEAMAAGCPCIVARAAALPEVCGDAAIYFDPTNTADIAGRVVDVLTDVALQRDLSTRGRARAASFTWSRPADIMVAQLERILTGR